MQLPHETPRAAAAFIAYCELGYGRSLAKLAEKLGNMAGRSPVRARTLEYWSAKHHWQERVKFFDQEAAAKLRLEHEAAIGRMNEYHSTIGCDAAQLAVKKIQELMAEDRFSAHAAVQLLKVSTDLERLARGATTASIKLDMPQDQHIGRNVLSIDITQLTNDELLMLEGIVQRIEGEEKGAA